VKLTPQGAIEEEGAHAADLRSMSSWMLRLRLHLLLLLVPQQRPEVEVVWAREMAAAGSRRPIS
jgi:hypothetical protein